jgi:Flp pilus assembly protein TadD
MCDTAKSGGHGVYLRVAKACAALSLILLVARCNTVGEQGIGPAEGSASADLSAEAPAFGDITPTLSEPEDIKYYRSDEPLQMGLQYFQRGYYGLAERYFQDAVEKAPKDPTAWVGLAATYDRLGRFDLADRAYLGATRLVGETTEILNNKGYSYMLRGDLQRARQKLTLAYARDPHNPTIANNLELLNGSSRYIRRSP